MNRYAAQPDPEVIDAGPDGPKMWSQNLVVLYETDVDIAAMLPRPLEATEPIVRINLACVDMPMMYEPLQAGTFSVRDPSPRSAGGYLEQVDGVWTYRWAA